MIFIKCICHPTTSTLFFSLVLDWTRKFRSLLYLRSWSSQSLSEFSADYLGKCADKAKLLCISFYHISVAHMKIKFSWLKAFLHLYNKRKNIRFCHSGHLLKLMVISSDPLRVQASALLLWSVAIDIYTVLQSSNCTLNSLGSHKHIFFPFLTFFSLL